MGDDDDHPPFFFLSRNMIVHTHMHTRARARTHIHTHTHTHIHTLSKSLNYLCIPERINRRDDVSYTSACRRCHLIRVVWNISAPAGSCQDLAVFRDPTSII